MPSGNIMTEIQHNKRRGYFNFGGGTSLNLNGDVGYHILNTDKDKLNVWFSHRSTNGNVKYIDTEEKIKAKLNDNLGGLNFKHAFNKAVLDMGIKYGYSGFNYYGLPVIDLTSPIPMADQLATYDRETNQANQTIQAKIGIESKEEAPIGYLLDLGYTNFSQKHGRTLLLNPHLTLFPLEENLQKGFSFFCTYHFKEFIIISDIITLIIQFRSQYHQHRIW